MKISFHGAARSVTGSRHLIQAGSSRLLLDCGMFQGRRDQAAKLNRHLGFDPKSLTAVCLSHAHIDHSGILPVLAREGYSGSVYMTDATADLTNILLADSARIQQSDCRYVNKRERRRGKDRITPFYSLSDVQTIAQQFSRTRYGTPVQVAPNLNVKFHDAGHILGSAAIWVQYRQRGQSRSLLFSGDLGRANMPILRDPQPPPPCDVLVIESTYGDRLHEDAIDARRRLARELVEHAIQHRSKIIVPAFSVGRTQEIIIRIKEMVKAGVVDPIPIYIDSPLALKAMQVFRRHPECYDEETYRTFTSEGDPFAAKYIRYVTTAKDSKALNAKKKGPLVIISASGMCEGGRVVHHLKHTIEDEANVIAIVGWQAEHTLGRKLVEEWDTVPIFGVPTRRRARVVRFNGFSAHADRNDLLAYVRAIQPIPQKVFVVHGEERQSLAFAMTLKTEFPGMEVEVPRPDSTHDA
jgi:metallo-beta-lactamase family protein